MKNKWWKNPLKRDIVISKISNTLKQHNELNYSFGFMEVFKSKYTIDPKTRCWIYIGGKINNKGFSSIRYKEKIYNVHRLAYELRYGKIYNKTLYVVHKCNNNSCINPKHLCLKTAQELNTHLMNKNIGRISQLSEDQKKEIKRLYIEESIPRAELRNRFNTSLGIINFIIDYR